MINVLPINTGMGRTTLLLDHGYAYLEILNEVLDPGSDFAALQGQVSRDKPLNACSTATSEPIIHECRAVAGRRVSPSYESSTSITIIGFNSLYLGMGYKTLTFGVLKLFKFSSHL